MQKDILWPAKVIILLQGMNYPILGIILILLDGRFHLSSHEVLVEQSPDWIIARGLFNSPGFSEFIHKLMAIFLILCSLISSYLLFTRRTKTSFYRFYRFILMPFTLMVIAFAITLKNLVLSGYLTGPKYEGSNVAFL